MSKPAAKPNLRRVAHVEFAKPVLLAAGNPIPVRALDAGARPRADEKQGSTTMRTTGTVKWFNDTKGFGTGDQYNGALAFASCRFRQFVVSGSAAIISRPPCSGTPTKSSSRVSLSIKEKEVWWYSNDPIFLSCSFTPSSCSL